MHRLTIQSLLSLLLVGTLTFGLAVSPAIGVAVASGTFRVDDSRVSGNTSLFEGNTIETGKVPSQVQLHGGVRMQLGSASRGKFYRDHMVLEQGQTQLETDTTYRIEALNLRVSTAARNSSTRVSFNGPNRVQVAALGGPVRVASRDGVLLANLEPGKALDFEPQAAGAAAPSTVIGRLQRRDGRLLVTDETTGVTVEVTGTGLENKVGQRVEVTGNLDPSAKPAPGASQVLLVTSIKVLPRAAASAAATGMAVSTKAIIAGVAVAAAGTGLGVGLTSGNEEKKTPLSR